MKNKLLVIGAIVLILVIGLFFFFEYTGGFLNDDAVAKHVNTLLQEKYGKYFDNLDLFCCDYGTDEGVFEATVYATDERYEFGAKYDLRKKILTTDAALEWHEDKMRNVITKMITTTMGSDKFVKDHYYLEVYREYTQDFIEDYEKFVADKGTTIEVMLHFDRNVTDDDAVRVQTLMKQLSDNHFNGIVECINDDYRGGEFTIGKTYTIKDLKKCDEYF